ncbi:hypothetical protein SLEP1_g54281 [Rubroshorea leprosula]|uniref:NB-ARC domain-containing protein n=1 Tax=Rubroshorea leprosula TaxID=152421 RepID=A0AAV5MBX9_9ROSI|nr:hypothetical protein SLEP1_g54281 [Rubroshorea leprosula]
MFVRKWKANVKILSRQVGDLEEEKQCVQRYIDDPNKSSARSVSPKLEWAENAKKFIDKANELVKIESGNADDDNGGHGTKQNCAFGLCLGPKSPYILSKRAKRRCKDVAKLVQEARGFEEITPPYRQEKEAVSVFEHLDSRKDVVRNILEALKSPSTNVIGVDGKQGAGKTLLSGEIKAKAEGQKLFDAVVMPTLSRNAADLPRIQGEIQRALGPDRVSVSNKLTTHQEAEAFNPRKARRTEKEVLVILDNIWGAEIYYKLRDRLPLVEENEGSLLSYKILLTSTDEAVLSDLSEKQFEIKLLQEKEPEQLFKRIVGNPTESLRLQIMIAQNCGELPLAVATVANAFKNSNQISWKTVIRELKRSKTEHKLQLALEISYSCLNKQLQQTFLLCTLMDDNAAIQDLLKYGVGLGLFPRVNSIEEARGEVLNSVAKLRDSLLLLDSGSNLHFNMPDLRDIAKLFASTEVGLENWLEESRKAESREAEESLEVEERRKAIESIKWIFLSNDDAHRLPDELNCPQLTLFHLSEQDPSSPIPPDLFRGTGELRVLGLTKTWSMPQSISLLNNLQTLRLDRSVLKVEDTGAVIGKLKNLQVLSLVGCDIEELPEQIGQLAELKLLDLSDCNNLKVVPSGVLSSLSKLEELYMRNGFDQWEIEDVKEQENKNASLSELKHLNLTAIEVRINIRNIQMIKEDLFPETLARYMILVGDMWHSWDSSFGSSKMLKLMLDARISSEHSVNKLLKKTEELHLQGLSGVNNVVNELDEEGFQELKYLFIQDAQNIDLVSSNSMKPAFPKLEVLVLRNLDKMEKICNGSVRRSSFSNLRMITVEFCNLLKNLFSSSIAKRNLLQLQEIRVMKCSKMQWIFGDENDTLEATKLKELRSLQLEDLPELIGFSSSCKRMKLSKEQVGSSRAGKRIASFSGDKLKKLIIKGCDTLECISSSSMAGGLSMLEHLEIRKCSGMEKVIFADNNEEGKKSIFPRLNILQIEDLDNLVNFYSENCIVEFEALKKLHVLNCPKLEVFIANTESLFNEQVEFPSLEFLRLSSLNSKQIWHISSEKTVSVKNLKKLVVEGCGNLEYLLRSSMVESFEQLMVLKISDCKMMEEVIKEEGGMCEIFFRELDTLELEDLPKLTRFKCPPAASVDKVRFPKLKFLSLSSIDIQQIWQISIPTNSLEKLFVEDCGNLKYLLMSSMVNSFKQLKVLKICDCKMMEQVIVLERSEENECKSFFSKLDTLELEDLPKLARLCHGNYLKFEFSNLRQFTISKCAVLKKLIGDIAVSDENAKNTYTLSLFDEKVESPRLERLIIKFMGSYNKIWDDKNDANSCCKLNSLTVASCEKLLNIFPYSMQKEVLQKLETLEIWNCDSLEEIFAESQQEAQETTTNSVKIAREVLFPKLTHLNLFKLPKLKGFFSQMHINEWPSLKQLWVYGCDEVHIFASELPSFLGINGDDRLQIQWISKNILLYQRSGKICYMLPAGSLNIGHADNPSYWRWIDGGPEYWKRISTPNSRSLS